MNDIQMTPEIDPHAVANALAMDSPSWAIGKDGQALARDGDYTLRSFVIEAVEGHRYAWEVSVHGHRLGSSEHLPMGERPKDDGAARVGAERFAAHRSDLANGYREDFPPGFELQVPAWWIVKQLGLEDGIAANGGWGDVSTEAMVLITRGLDGWDCGTTISTAKFCLEPDDDAHAAEIVEAWAKYSALQGASRASDEAQAEHAANKQAALDAVAGLNFIDDNEPEAELEVPDRTADLVRTEKLHAFVGLSDEEKLAIGDELVEEMRLMEVEEAAKKLAVEAYNKAIKEHETRARQLAKRRREGGEKQPVPHRLAFYYEENVVVVIREDTGKETDRRRMTTRERASVAQGELPLEAGEGACEDENAQEGAGEATAEPFELVVGMDLVSTGGSGGMVRVLELHPADQDDEESVAMVTTQKLTKTKELHGRAKPQRVARAALFAAYRPVEAPSAPDQPAE